MPTARQAPLRRTRKLARLVRTPRYRQALRHGVAAAIEHAEIPYPLTYRTVIDVGANHGQFALFALERFPEARVICVEPLPESVARLEKAVGSDPRVTVLAYAAGDGAGEHEFYVTASDDSSSLLPVAPAGTAAFGTEVVATTRVEVRPLADLLSPESLEGPTLLKVDVQGTEYETLRGAEALLPRLDSLVVECSFKELYAEQRLADDVVGLLRDAGFRWLGAVAAVQDETGEMLQADMLFGRRQPSSASNCM
jgi:FkbM family methyltransferase